MMRNFVRRLRSMQLPRGLTAIAGVCALGLAACTGVSERHTSSVSGTARPTTTTSAPSSAATPAVTALPGIDQAPEAPRYPLPGAAGPVVDGIDWREPDWVRPAANSDFYSERPSAPDGVLVRAIDQSWRQLQPTTGATIYTDVGQAQQMSFDPLVQQPAEPGDFLDAHFRQRRRLGPRLGRDRVWRARLQARLRRRSAPAHLGRLRLGGICSISIARSS